MSVHTSGNFHTFSCFLHQVTWTLASIRVHIPFFASCTFSNSGTSKAIPSHRVKALTCRCIFLEYFSLRTCNASLPIPVHFVRTLALLYRCIEILSLRTWFLAWCSIPISSFSTTQTNTFSSEEGIIRAESNTFPIISDGISWAILAIRSSKEQILIRKILKKLGWMSNTKYELRSCPTCLKDKPLLVIVDDKASYPMNSGVASSNLNLRSMKQFLVSFVSEGSCQYLKVSLLVGNIAYVNEIYLRYCCHW